MAIGSGVAYVTGMCFLGSALGKRKRNYQPVNFAYGVAEEYNRALIEQIKKDR